MGIVRLILGIVLNLAAIIMWARLILDYARFFAPRWKPKGPLLVVCEAVYAVTDPVLRAVRRLVPPLRVGQVSIDLAWLIVMFAIGILQSLVGFIR